MTNSEIYREMFSRISDLNKTSFQYRFLYLALLAGYYTSLSFVADIASYTRFFAGPVAYELIIVTLTVATFVGVVSFYFFDCLNQELVEHCIRAIKCIEVETVNESSKRIFSNHSATLISYRFSVVITLLYFIPAAGLMMYLSYFIQHISVTLEATPFVTSKVEFCGAGFGFAQKLDEFAAVALPDATESSETIQRIFNGICHNFATYDTSLWRAVLMGYTVALGFSALFIIITAQRLLSRIHVFLRVSIFDKYWIDKAAVVLTTVVSCFFLAVLVGVMLDNEFSQKFVFFWVFDMAGLNLETG